MKVLNLNLKKQCFDMILSGEKTEEYREIKPYWIRRFVNFDNYPKESADDFKYMAENIHYDIVENGYPADKVLTAYYGVINSYDAVRFSNGYGKNAPSVTVECKGIVIGIGVTAWGAVHSIEYFVIKLGKILTHTP